MGKGSFLTFSGVEGGFYRTEVGPSHRIEWLHQQPVGEVLCPEQSRSTPELRPAVRRLQSE